ncbi:MAG: hypothetical protein FJ405_13580 [Verrucomicrobia bacterium]|nr:hypothetical protein [Verrucomicrobiota bacterium]
MTLCPRDQRQLATNQAAKFRYLSCLRCQGHWIPGGALDRAIPNFASHVSPCPHPTQPVFNCFQCQKPMGAVQARGCQLDLCPSCHSLWIDGPELKRLETLFARDSEIRTGIEYQDRQAGTSSLDGVEVVLEMLMMFLD